MVCQIRCLSSIKLVKDKHNVILILVSSKWLIPYFGGSSKSLFSFGQLSFREFQVFFPRYLVAKLHLNHRKASPCVFNFSFLSFDHPFVTGVLHGGSTWWFIKELIHSRSVHWDFFSEELKYSSSCIPKCNSFYLIIWGGVMSLLIISLRVAWFTGFQEWHI